MKIIVVGAGFGGLSAAAYLARAGHDVTVLEKNEQPGGRATVIREAGFTFDAGPSWYLMPDVYDEFFADFGLRTSDYYELKDIEPSYRVYDTERTFDVPRLPEVVDLFEAIEPGSGARLQNYLMQTKSEYADVRKDLMLFDGLSLGQFLSPSALRFVANPRMVAGLHQRIARITSDPALQHTLEFMTVFMGGSPKNIPALYGLLSWVDMGLGVKYPMGGYGAVARAFATVAEQQGAKLVYDAAVTRISTQDNGMRVMVGDTEYTSDTVVVNADYQHVEEAIVDDGLRSYDQSYWKGKTLSPSGVIGLLGVKGRVPLAHHSLFFDTDWEGNFADVFERHQYNKKPLFYTCTPSVTDPTVAPEGHENMFVLIPVSGKVSADAAAAEALVDNAIGRMSERSGYDIAANLVVKQVLDKQYFVDRFNASEGNAFGLAHTMLQSGPLRPRIRSRKSNRLYYTGQFTNPGTGVPLVIMSGKVVADRLIKDHPA